MQVNLLSAPSLPKYRMAKYRVTCYASKSLNKAQSRFSATKRELLTIVNYTRHFKHYLLGRRFKIITDHRALQWLHNFKDPDALTARWLEKLAAFAYEIEHRSGRSIGYADCMSRLPATTAAVNMTATKDLEASVVGQPNHSSQSLPSCNSHTPPAQPPHSATLPRDTVKSNQIDDEQSGVKYGHEAGTNRNSQTDDEQSGVKDGHEAGTNRNSQTDDEQSGVKDGHEDEAGTNRNSPTDDEQSEVRNWNEAMANKNGQTDDKQSGITHGHEARANKPVSHFTVIEQQGDLLDSPHLKAYCVSADFKLGAGLAKQIKEKFPSYFPTKTEYKQQVLHAQYLGHDKFVFHLIVKPRYFLKPIYRSPRKTLLALRDQMNFYRIDNFGIPQLSCGLNKLDWTEVQKINQKGAAFIYNYQAVTSESESKVRVFSPFPQPPPVDLTAVDSLIDLVSNIHHKVTSLPFLETVACKDACKALSIFSLCSNNSALKSDVRNLLQRQATFEKSLHRVQEANDEKFFLLATEIADTQKSVEALRDVIDARLNSTGEAIRQLDSRLIIMSNCMST